MRGVDGSTGVRSGADGRRRRKRRRGSVGRSGRGGGTRAQARCAQAVAGTSPTPGGGGARPRRRANEVPGNAGTPTPARIRGNNPPRVRHLQRHSPCWRQAPRRAPSAAPRAHAPPEERSPRAAPDCSPRPRAGAPPRTRGSWGGGRGKLSVGVGAESGTQSVCDALDPRDLALPPAPQHPLAPERRGCRAEVKRYHSRWRARGL